MSSRIALLTVSAVAAAALSSWSSAAAGAAPPPVHRAPGLCLSSSSISGSTFNYKLCGLPDLNQHRKADPSMGILGLPDQGASWCAPTATMDAFAYFAANGLSGLPPGDSDWTDAANYNTMTTDLLNLGADMKTSGTGGTSATDMASGARKWLAASGLASLELSFSPTNAHVAPTLEQIAAAGASGAVVIVHVVFASPSAPGSSTYDVHDGHFIAVSLARSPSTIGLTDPATPTTRLTYQPPYTQEIYPVTPMKVTLVHSSRPPTTNTYLVIDGYKLSSNFNMKGYTTFITSFAELQPEQLIWWAFGGKGLHFASALGKHRGRSVNTAGPLVSVAIDPTDSEDFYTEQGSSTIWALDAAGHSTAFAADQIQPGQVAFDDPADTLLVAGGGSAAAPGTGGLTEYNTAGKLTGTVATGGDPVDALAVDQQTGDVFAFSSRSDTLRVLNSQLQQLAQVEIPAAVLPGGGAVSVAARGHVIYFHRAGERLLARMLVPESANTTPSYRRIRLAGGAGSTGIAVDAAGRIFVTGANGRLAEYTPGGAKIVRSRFTGLPGGAELAVNSTYRGAARMPFPLNVPGH